MRQPLPCRAGLAVALAALAAAMVLGACNLFEGPQQEIWVCLDPATGKESEVDYDPNHYVNGVFDPCNCYDPCGPLPQCPSVIDAGPLPAYCDAGAGDDGGDGGW